MQNQPAAAPLGVNQASVSKPAKKLTTNNLLFIGMVILGVIIVISGGAWLYLSTIASSDNGKTQLAAYNLIEPKDTRPVNRVVESTLGVKVAYNASLLSGFGFADVITYSSSDLDAPRPYSVIRIRPIETSEATRNPITIDAPELRITTSLEQDFWTKFQKDKELKDLSKTDALIKTAIDERTKANKNITASEAQAVTLGDDIQYKKVTFTTEDQNSAVPSVSRENCYITVQNDRPYVACINNIRPSNFGSVPQLEAVLNNLSYQAPDEDALQAGDSGTKDKSLYDGKDDQKIEASTTDTASQEATKDSQAGAKTAKVPSYIAASEDFKVIASSIPATVRVGTIYCANITLTLPDDSRGVSLTGACVDRSSTGFFVSKDGLLATLASQVKVTPTEAVQAYISNAPDSSETESRLQRILEYLQSSRTIMESDADELTFGLQQRDREAIAKINSLAKLIASENITIDSEEYKYAVQLSDKPIVVNRSGNDSLEFAYSDSVYEASLEGVEHDDIKNSVEVFKGDTSGKDIALLKLKKESTYPTLTLAESSSLSNGAIVNIVGRPMYAFGSLEAGQIWPTTLIRQGKADQSFNVSAGQRLQTINTPSHAGLAGSPALNSAGKVVGMATYDQANCPDNKCFASLHLRDPALLLSIAKQRNITVQSASVVSDVWKRAVSQYVRGNYQTANELFNQSAKLYPQNYLAPQFAALSADQIGSATDTSKINWAIELLKIVILIALIILVILIIIRLFMKVFSKPQYKTQYGQLANGEYIDARQWQPGGGYANQSSTTAPPAYVPTQTPAAESSNPAMTSYQSQPPQSSVTTGPGLGSVAETQAGSFNTSQTVQPGPVGPSQPVVETPPVSTAEVAAPSSGLITDNYQPGQPPAINSSVPQTSSNPDDIDRS